MDKQSSRAKFDSLQGMPCGRSCMCCYPQQSCKNQIDVKAQLQGRTQANIRRLTVKQTLDYRLAHCDIWMFCCCLPKFLDKSAIMETPACDFPY